MLSVFQKIIGHGTGDESSSMEPPLPPPHLYSLNDLLDIDNRVTFFLGNSGTGKTRGFIEGILPHLRCPGGIYIGTSDPRDFEGVTHPDRIHILDSGFQLNQTELEKLPARSLLFYGKSGWGGVGTNASLSSCDYNEVVISDDYVQSTKTTSLNRVINFCARLNHSLKLKNFQFFKK